MSQSVTLGRLAAQLVVDGCIPLANEERPRGELPVRGQQLTQTQRANLQIAGGSKQGSAFFYPVGGNGVFMDLSVGVATVWFKGADDAALNELEAGLRRAYPAFQFIEEAPHPDDPQLRVRAYIIELTPPKRVSLEVAHSVQGARSPQFTVRVRAFKKTN